jgi:1-deoxy-D-xylulose-5-phosphate reductoisomerase
MERQRVLIFGSTGSIGQNSLQVLSAMPDRFEVVGLAAGSNWSLLAKQVREHDVPLAAMSCEDAAEKLSGAVDGQVRVLQGPDAMVSLLDAVEFDCVIVGVVGADALPATVRAVEMGKRVAIANKESLVIAGPLLTELAEKTGAELLPVDSEHSAVFQAMHAGRSSDVRRVILTASGGPFWNWPAESIATATLQDALKHPTWCMGPKITIDSATMMNKGLEIVEARWLFGLDDDQIDVIIHPQSIVHSVVEFVDGSMIAQLGTPDMRTPIQYALTYPDRVACPSPRLDLSQCTNMNFYPPDSDRFPALRIGHQVAASGGTCGAVMNAANESAVELFREGVLSFADITSTVDTVLQKHDFQSVPSLDELIRADQWAREEVHRCLTC